MTPEEKGMGQDDRTPEAVIAEALHARWWNTEKHPWSGLSGKERDWPWGEAARSALAALEGAGYTVARLERMGIGFEAERDAARAQVAALVAALDSERAEKIAVMLDLLGPFAADMGERFAVNVAPEDKVQALADLRGDGMQRDLREYARVLADISPRSQSGGNP